MRCKICDSLCIHMFDLPSEKFSGGELDVGGVSVPYFRCSACEFLFCDYVSGYGDDYWESYDPVPEGRSLETVRLYLHGGGRQGFSCLDYGCGKGFGVETLRRIGVEAAGADIFVPEWAGLHRIEDAPEADVVVACEVVEHFLNPVASFKHMWSLARHSIAFQTAVYDPKVCKRDWWYLGPANGHVSLYSAKTFLVLSEILQVGATRMWHNYPGIQAWFK